MVARYWSKFLDRALRPPRQPRPMGLVAVQMSINPFEFYMLFLACMVGILYLIGLPPPSPVRTLLGPVAVMVWAANLGIGGLTALIGGMWYRNMEKGLAAYQFGWGLVGVSELVYGASLLILFPVPALFPGLSNAIIALACFTRVLQIQRFFRLSEQLLAEDAAAQAEGTAAQAGGRR